VTESSRAGRVFHPSRRAAWGVAFLAAALVALPTVSADSAPSSAHAFASYDTGRIHVVLPSARPSVELFQDANSSVSALLAATSVVELAPSGAGYTAVASATPTLATSFNSSRPAATVAPWALSLAAGLAVRPATGSFWNGTPAAGPSAGASFGFAELRVDLAPGPTSSAGSSLRVGWTVSNWPLVQPDDLVGVVFSFSAPNAPSLNSCVANSGLAAPSCLGAPLQSGQVRWNGGLVGVEAEGSSGAVASLGWSPSATNDTAAPAATGTRLDSAGGADVVVASAAGPSAASGAVAFSLFAPGPPVVPTAVVGIGPVYLIAAALAAGGALGGLVIYRDRDERIRREL
jgi:hypothetical protein